MNTKYRDVKTRIVPFAFAIVLIGLVILYYIPSYKVSNLNKSVNYSYELKEIAIKSGEIERRDYINSRGQITYATDKHYATVIIYRDESHNTIVEQYYDEQGNPAIQTDGNYGIRHKYNEKGQNIETTYLDEKGNLMVNRLGYVTLRRTFNSDGKKENETFYDENDVRVTHKYDGYGRHYDYDDVQDSITITYLDRDEKPMYIKAGYSKIKRSFWPNKELKTELYFDVDGQPIKLSLGQYGIYKEFDDHGREKLVTYLDESEHPMNIALGYATVKYIYDNGITTEMYYDHKGQPVQLSRGQYGIKKLDNQVVYLNEKGEELFELSNYLRHHPWCLIITAFVVIVLATTLNNKGNIYLWIAGVLFLIYITLLHRESEGADANFELFWSYKQFFIKNILRVEILNNIWLFIPLGCILYNLLYKSKALLILVLISVCIELCQLIFHIGLCELDDVLSNGIGSVIGYCVGYIINSIKEEKRKIQ